MKNDFWDAVIIGAGVLGVFHACFACRSGLRTLLLERDTIPSEASVRNFGMVIPSAMPRGDWLRRAQKSAAEYRRIAQMLGFPLQTTGTQYLASQPREVEVFREFVERASEWGYRCELLNADESIAKNPAIDPNYCRESLHFPDDLRFDPRHFLRQLIVWLCENDGLNYRPFEVVLHAESGVGACGVTTASGKTYRGAHVFVCSGADLRTLFPERFAAAGLIRCKLQMMRTAPQTDALLSTSLASGLSLRRYPSFQQCDAWQRLAEEPIDSEVADRGIHVLLVQDADGSVVVGDSHEYTSGEFSTERDSHTDELILKEAQRMVRLDSWRISKRWTGVYSLHPQAEVFAETIDDRIHLLTGVGGKGMTIGPALARERIEGVFGNLPLED